MGLYLLRYTCEACGEREGMVFADLDQACAAVAVCTQCGRDCLGFVGNREDVDPNLTIAEFVRETFGAAAMDEFLAGT